MGEQLKFKNENMTQKEGPAVTIMPVSSIVLELRDARKNDIEEAKGCHRHAQALASCICKVNPPQSWLKLSQIQPSIYLCVLFQIGAVWPLVSQRTHKG